MDSPDGSEMEQERDHARTFDELAKKRKKSTNEEEGIRERKIVPVKKVDSAESSWDLTTYRAYAEATTSECSARRGQDFQGRILSLTREVSRFSSKS